MYNRSHGYKSISEVAGSKLLSAYNEYASDRSLLTFMCSNTGMPFKTTAFLYKRGQTTVTSSECDRDTTKYNFVVSARKRYGSYFSYDMIVDDMKWDQDVSIICPAHGVFTVSPIAHINGDACTHCQVESTTAAVGSPLQQFIIKASHKHNFKYRYDGVTWNGLDTPTNFICSKHGTFITTPQSHLDGIHCSICSTSSYRLDEITAMLTAGGIIFSTEKTFANCVSAQQRALRFDIYIPQKNLCIELDSIHHYQPTKYSSNTSDEDAEKYYKIQRENDEIKHQYCIDHNINLIRIPYTVYHPEAEVLRYLSQLPDQRTIYTWSDFTKDIERIVNYIKTFNYSKFAIYGVSRGGVPFSVHISNHMEGMCEYGMVGFQRYDGDDDNVHHLVDHHTSDIPIFVIDDLTSSGITMNKVVQSLRDKYPHAQHIHPIVIFGSANDSGIFYIREHPKQWIVFPYEI